MNADDGVRGWNGIEGIEVKSGHLAGADEGDSEGSVSGHHSLHVGPAPDGEAGKSCLRAVHMGRIELCDTGRSRSRSMSHCSGIRGRLLEQARLTPPVRAIAGRDERGLDATGNGWRGSC